MAAVFTQNDKSYFGGLSDIGFKDPSVAVNQDLAFSIPLFESGYLRSIDESSYLETFNEQYTKAGMWAAMSFLWNSDLGANGVKFYFHVETTLADIVVPYLESNGVPKEFIRVITLPDSWAYDPEMNFTQFGKKLLWVHDTELDVNSVCTIDSDVFLCAKGDQAEIFRDLTSPLVKKNIGVYEYRFVRYNYAFRLTAILRGAGISRSYLDKTGWVVTGSDIGDSKNIIDPLSIERAAFNRYDLEHSMAENVPSSDYVARPYLSANMFQVSKYNPIVKFVKDYGHQAYCDEAMICLYLLGNNIMPLKLNEVLGIPRFLGKMGWSSEVDTYLAHYLDDDTDLHPAHLDFYQSMMRIFYNMNR